MPKFPKDSEEFESQWREVTSGLDPRTMEGAAAFAELRTIFQNLLRAGFTEKQAIRLLAYGMFQMPEEEPEG